MKLVTKVKLLPTPEQANLLRETLERANAACNKLSQIAWQAQAFGKWKLQELAYRVIREEFGLSAQVAVRCVAKVAGAYAGKKKRQRQHLFKPHGAIAYDARLLTWHPDSRTVSIWTVAGRMLIAYTGAEWQHALLKHQKGESDLLYWQGTFYLTPTCEQYSGSHLRSLRTRHARLRAKPHKKSTKSAKRLHSWSFADLQQKIKYKARLAGIPVWLVSPRYTTQTCSCCGHIDRRNRVRQDAFRCTLM